MDSSEHDTIDLEEELGDIDAVLAGGSLAVAAEGRRAGIVELVLVSLANGIWAVVGLVLWLPQSLRAVLGAALRVIHSALTHQSSHRAVAGIKQVSRLYVDRFLHRRGEPVFVGRRHELRPIRLVGETVWVVGFYLLVLRWLSPTRFAPIWERLTSWGRIGWDRAVAAVNGVGDLLAAGVATLGGARLQMGAALVAVALLCGLLGFWLGRRKR